METAPIFLNPPHLQDRSFGVALRHCLIEKGVDVDYLDLKAFQVRHENFEFDVPAYPRTESSCWGYIWANELVKNSVLLETLQPEDEYLRGFLEKTTEEFSRKMTIHYRSVDWQTRKEKCLDALKEDGSTWTQIYKAAKVEATADFIQEDADGYSDLFRNNSYITTFEDGDTFGYNIPSSLESKLEGLMKYDFDRTSSAGSVDLSPYVSQLTTLSTLTTKATGGASGAVLADFAKGYLTASTADLAECVSFFSSACPTLMGSVPAKISDKVSKVCGLVKAADQRVAAMRGMASSVETAAIKGKTDGELAAQFADVCEQRLNNLVRLANFVNNVGSTDLSQVLVSTVFNNLPDAFSQFAVDAENVQNFVSTNAAAFDKVGSSIAGQKENAAAIAQGLDSASAAIGEWMQENLNLDKQSLAAANAQVTNSYATSGTHGAMWFVTAAEQRAANTTGLDKIEAMAVAKALSNPRIGDCVGFKLYAKLAAAGAGKYSGCVLKGAAAGLSTGTFGTKVADQLSAFLASSGGATPTQAELVASKVSSLPVWRDLGKTAEAANQCYSDTDAAMASIQWVVESDSIPALRQAAFGLPHPSYDNINCY